MLEPEDGRRVGDMSFALYSFSIYLANMFWWSWCLHQQRLTPCYHNSRCIAHYHHYARTYTCDHCRAPRALLAHYHPRCLMIVVDVIHQRYTAFHAPCRAYRTLRWRKVAGRGLWIEAVNAHRLMNSV